MKEVFHSISQPKFDPCVIDMFKTHVILVGFKHWGIQPSPNPRDSLCERFIYPILSRAGLDTPMFKTYQYNTCFKHVLNISITRGSNLGCEILRHTSFIQHLILAHNSITCHVF